MILDARIPPVLRRRMVLARSGLARRPVDVLAVRASRHSIVVPEEPTTTQLREQQVDDVFEGAGFDGVGLDWSVPFSQIEKG